MRRRLFPFLSPSYSHSHSHDNCSVYRSLSLSLTNIIVSSPLALVDPSFSFSSSVFPSLSIPSPLSHHSRHTHRTLLPKAAELTGLSGHRELAGAGAVTPTISTSLTEKIRCVQRRGVPSYRKKPESQPDHHLHRLTVPLPTVLPPW